jgi:hypothetical protein
MYSPSGEILKEVFSGFLKKSSMGIVRSSDSPAHAASTKIPKQKIRRLIFNMVNELVLKQFRDQFTKP